MITNFHTHCAYCDGKETPEAYVKEALKNGFISLGFSCHGTVPFGSIWHMKEERIIDYLEEIKRLKKVYSDKIEIYTGLEIDYLEEDNRNIFYRYPLDYKLGSVHFLRDKANNYHAVDAEAETFELLLKELAGGDIKKLVGMYYENLLTMVRVYKPDIIGHIDLIKKNNADSKYFNANEAWYLSMVHIVLEEIKRNNLIVEVNTGGIIRGYLKEIYPSPEILRECRKMDIPIMLNSDAHSPRDIDGYFHEARSIIKEAGYSKQRIMLKGQWTDIDI